MNAISLTEGWRYLFLPTDTDHQTGSDMQNSLQLPDDAIAGPEDEAEVAVVDSTMDGSAPAS